MCRSRPIEMWLEMSLARYQSRFAHTPREVLYGISERSLEMEDG